MLSDVWIAALLLNLYSDQTCKLILSPIWQDFTLTVSEMEYLMKKLISQIFTNAINYESISYKYLQPQISK